MELLRLSSCNYKVVTYRETNLNPSDELQQPDFGDLLAKVRIDSNGEFRTEFDLRKVFVIGELGQ